MCVGHHVIPGNFIPAEDNQSLENISELTDITCPFYFLELLNCIFPYILFTHAGASKRYMMATFPKGKPICRYPPPQIRILFLWCQWECILIENPSSLKRYILNNSINPLRGFLDEFWWLLWISCEFRLNSKAYNISYQYYRFLLLRSVADSNRRTRFCRPLPSHSVNRPFNSGQQK